MNKADIVFKKISDDEYKMIANRNGNKSEGIFTEEEISIIAHKYSVEVK